jgi:hypothetical protein
LKKEKLCAILPLSREIASSKRDGKARGEKERIETAGAQPWTRVQPERIFFI